MGEGGGLGVSPNYLWWQRVGAAWPDEVKRRKRHRLLYHVEEVFLAEYFARQAPARVLEFGCGFGRHLRYLAGIEQLEVHGFDQSETLLGEMQGWAPPGWVEERIRVGAPLAPLPYRDGEFDVVFTVSVLIHNRPEHLERVLRELVRVCRGHLLLIENVPVSETGLSSDEHDGCWLHPLQRHFARMGLTCEPLPSCFVEHGVYRVRVDPAARVADLHPTTLENLRRMQEEMAGFFETGRRSSAGTRTTRRCGRASRASSSGCRPCCTW
ncbi:MAG: class I SAM-dependent methyltransferase [Deltaproteobacteria bacterium]|nr:MAG: class I SAM-dependent methyltransferase [Deltaproteobacteria bacterium]